MRKVENTLKCGVGKVASERTGEIKNNSNDSLLILHLLHTSDTHRV